MTTRPCSRVAGTHNVSILSLYYQYYKRTPQRPEQVLKTGYFSEFSTSPFSSELADIPELLTVLHRRITRLKYGVSQRWLLPSRSKLEVGLRQSKMKKNNGHARSSILQ